MTIRCPVKDIETVFMYMLACSVGSVVDTRIGSLEKTGDTTFKLRSKRKHDASVMEALCAHDDFDIGAIFDKEEENEEW